MVFNPNDDKTIKIKWTIKSIIFDCCHNTTNLTKIDICSGLILTSILLSNKVDAGSRQNLDQTNKYNYARIRNRWHLQFLKNNVTWFTKSECYFYIKWWWNEISVFTKSGMLSISYNLLYIIKLFILNIVGQRLSLYGTCDLLTSVVGITKIVNCSRKFWNQKLTVITIFRQRLRYIREEECKLARMKLPSFRVQWLLYNRKILNKKRNFIGV